MSDLVQIAGLLASVAPGTGLTDRPLVGSGEPVVSLARVLGVLALGLLLAVVVSVIVARGLNGAGARQPSALFARWMGAKGEQQSARGLKLVETMALGTGQWAHHVRWIGQDVLIVCGPSGIAIHPKSASTGAQGTLSETTAAVARPDPDAPR